MERIGAHFVIRVLACGFVVSLLALAGGACAEQTPPASAMPDDSGPAPDCPLMMQEAEMGFERARQAGAAKRWKEAVPLLREAGSAFLNVAASCPSVAAQANRQGDRAMLELKTAEAASAHQSDCQPRLDKALDLDLRATVARGEKGDPAQIEGLLAEAESTWREAVELCQPPQREKAEKSLAATIRVRSANAELLNSGPACDAAWKSATSLVDYAKTAWKDRRWDDAAMLYGKAAMAWEGAAEKCSGTRQQQAQRKVEQSQIDAHNAEHCGPLWDRATEHTQQLRTAGVAVSATDKDLLSMKAEVVWREAMGQCRGNPQALARTNADAIARERGTPLSPQAMVQYGSGKAPAPAVAPAVTPVALTARAPAVASAVVPSAVAPVAVAPVAPAPSVAQAEAPSATPGEVVLVAGDTTYRGAFVLGKSGAVSGSGTVEWTNGESYTGMLVDGRKHGKGRFNWVGGQWYEGDWDADRAVGYGVIRFAGGNRYEGAVVDGEPNGRGTQVFPSGDRYTGDFVRGVFHGRGSYAWKNGNRYDGGWNMGKKHGQGRLLWADGDGWEGEFHDDRQTESGRRIAASATR